MSRSSLLFATLALFVAAAIATLVVVDDAPDADSLGPDQKSTSEPSESSRLDRDDDQGLIEVQDEVSLARPIRVRIPTLGISSSLDSLGVLSDGTLATPPHWQVAGWYSGGPRPGETGPAVIAGHVDSPDGPAVFTGLDAITTGDTVKVDVAGGDSVSFRVDRTATAPKDSFPTEAVYGPTPDAQLRLITCSGAYDATTGGYQDNLIVYATALPR